jgi:hypothetical protein|tara:strand:- start:129 stop:347 length:219 start_codon:yes stop_codon:yes gene_type:complete
MEGFKNTKVSKPSNKLWFICWDNDRVEIKANGSIDIDQEISTSWTEIDYFNEEELWEEVLMKNGIESNQEIS